MSRVSMDPEAIHARLEIVSNLADLRPERRLDSKIDMSPAGVLARLRIASQLRDLCNALAQAGREGDENTPER